MPILNRDPWREAFYRGNDCPDDVAIPVKDPDAWALNPRHRWIYDKLTLAGLQGLACGPDGVMPDRFPVFSKPVYNLRSMGVDSGVLWSAAEWAERPRPGTMWCELLTGAHVSTDLAVVDGTPVWTCQTLGHPMPGGTFDRWDVGVAPDAAVAGCLDGFVRRHFPGYTGMMNLETIGGRIIEGHLRFSEQWTDLYGPDFVPALVSLYRDGRWTEAPVPARRGYSVVLFGPPPTARPPETMLAPWRAQPGIASIQLSWHADRPARAHAMPPGGFRLAIVNGWRLDACLAARAALAQAFGLERGAVAV